MFVAPPSRFRRCAAAVVAAVVLFSTAGIASFAQETAALLGTVFEPSGSPAQGFTVVFRDVASGREIRSGVTNAAGQYEVTIPVGGKYKLQSVLAPDGTTLPVQDVPPISVRVPGFNRVDVRFMAPAAPGEAPAGAPTTKPATAAKSDKRRDKSGLPWWKKPAGIVGIVLGVGALAALAAGGGGGGNPSPSTTEN